MTFGSHSEDHRPDLEKMNVIKEPSPETDSLLLVGHPKCGNVWLFALMKSLITASGAEFRQVLESQPISKAFDQMALSIDGQSRYDQVHFRPLRAYQTIPNIFYWAIEDIRRFAAETSLAHTHCEWTRETDWMIRAFKSRIAIVRDPRDVVVSFAQWMFSPFNRLHRPTEFPTPREYLEANYKQITHKWLAHQDSWLVRRDPNTSIQVVFYEQLVDDTPAELNRIANDLGLKVSEKLLQEIAKEHSLKNAKQTLPNHIWRGGWGNWLETLSEEQVLTIQEMTSGMLKKLGYPLNFEDAYDWQPKSLKRPH